MRSDLYVNLYNTESTHWWHRAKRKIVTYFIQNSTQQRSPIILDIGCGTGKNMDAFKSLGRVVGIDVSRTAVEFCKKRGLKTAIVGSAEKLPFSDSKIDVVTALDVIEHVDDTKTISEIWRVLKPGGILICTVPAYMWLWSDWDVALHHKKRYIASEIVALIEEGGLRVTKWSYLYSFLVAPILVVRTLKSLLQKKDKPYSSDFDLNNKLLNWALYFMAQLEHQYIKLYHVPFGTSVICIAKKPNNPK